MLSPLSTKNLQTREPTKPVPVLDTLVTFMLSPLSTKNLQTREPTKPVPPNTVTLNDDESLLLLVGAVSVVSVVSKSSFVVYNKERGELLGLSLRNNGCC